MAPNTPIQFKKAERSQAKMKLGVQGPSGSGKTLGALALACELARAAGGRVAVIDTENGSASLYSDRFDFDVLELRPPYESKRFLEGISAAAEAGYAVVVIDSMSHQWAGEGGILARKEQKDARGGNHFTNWAPFTKEHEEFKAGILNAPIHIIATLRTKTEYQVAENGGKAAPKKIGTAPVQREGMEYELSINFELQMDHSAVASKDRTGLFDGRTVNLADPKVAREILDWLASGKPLVEDPDVTEVKALMGHAAIGDDVRKTIESRLAKGTPSKETLAKWKAQLSEKIAKTQVGANNTVSTGESSEPAAA